MSKFNEYEKVERIEKEECRGLLEGKSYIFEKIDGANAQIYFDKDISYASRNRVLGIGDQLLSGDSFRGFYNWIQENSIPLYSFLNKYPNVTLYGEWLVKHTIQYPTEFMTRFYCFDIMDDLGKFFYPNDPIWNYLQSMFNYPIVIPCDGIVENCTIEDLKKYLEMPSHYGGVPCREGIVIKNYDFINKYGRNPYGKLLNKDFMEVKGKTKKNIDPSELEVELTNTYCTKARVAKICEKVKMNEQQAKYMKQSKEVGTYVDIIPLEMKDIPKIINMVFYDIITEDINDMMKRFKYPIIDFKKLKFLVFDSAKKYFVEYLEKQN